MHCKRHLHTDTVQWFGKMKEYIIKADFITEGDEFVLPDIVSELIRCKDCKLNPKRMLVGCPIAGCMSRTDEWYCPVGKPKENEK